tara:strand:- start:2627 stop:3442 length:816 start_codon:yes stop_codon:yes gene_type:complete
MAAQTPSEYYADDASWGNYQFITLKELVDEMLADSTDSDSYLANTKRSQIVRNLKRGIKELNRDTKKTVYAAQLTLGPKLYFALPQSYIDWVRVSVIDEHGRMQPLNINNKINTAAGYLQNYKHELLFDYQGQLLTTDMANAFQKPFIRHTVCTTNDTSLLSKFGEFKVSDDRSTIHFSSNLQGKDIVIEYLSDGLEMEKIKETEIKVNKSLTQAIRWFAISEILALRRNATQYDKTTTRNRYLKERHKALIDALNLDFNEIARVIPSMPN